MFTPNLRNIVGTQILALSSFASGMAISPSQAQGQERIFGFLFRIDNKFNANLAPDNESLVARRFIHEIDPSGDLMAQFESALHTRTALQINSGSFDRRGLPSRFEVTLSDESFIQLERSEISDFKITKDARLKLSGLTIPVSAISYIRPNPSVKYDLEWQRLIGEGNKSEDLIAIRRPHGKLDTLGGIVRSVSSEEVEFKVDNETYRVPYLRIEGIILANLKKPNLVAKPQALLETPNHTLRCCKVSLSDNGADAHLNVETPSGALATVALSEPLRLDRSQALATTLRDMAISYSRTPKFSDYSQSLPQSDKPLTLSPKPYSISGTGIGTSLTVNGGVSVEIKIPDGEHSLYFCPRFGRHSASSFTLRYTGEKPSSNVSYTQERFPSDNQVVDLRNELSLSGPGILVIEAGKTGEELRFETFFLISN